MLRRNVGGDCMDNKKYFSSIEEFNKTSPAYKMIINSLKELLPTKGNKFGFFFSVIIGFILAYIIGTSQNTVSILDKVSYNLMGALLALFGCVFSVYSIILAFLSDSYIKKLCEIDYDKNSTYLKQSTSYYESVLLLFFIAIILDLVLMVLMNSLPVDYTLTKNDFTNTILAIGSLGICFSYIFRVIYEIKSTIYNTIVLFRASIAYKLLGFVEEENEKNKNE